MFCVLLTLGLARADRFGQFPIDYYENTLHASLFGGTAKQYANNRSTIMDFPHLYDPDVHPFDLGKLEYYDDNHYGTRDNFTNIICESYEVFLKRHIAGDETLQADVTHIIDDELGGIMCKTWLDIRLSDDLDSGDYDGFTSAVFNNKDASRYRKVLKDEYAGRILEPVDVDVLMQVQGINEINLSEEYVDMTISLALTWVDPRLTWDLKQFNMISTISVAQHKVWQPDIHIINRAHEFSPIDEYKYKVKIDWEGRVYLTRHFRFKADIDVDISDYPADYQNAVIKLASLENNKDMVVLSTHRWNLLNGLDRNAKSALNIKNIKPVWNPFYDDNNEWSFESYSYRQSLVTDIIGRNEFSILEVELTCRRNIGFYSMTLFIPVFLLTLLAPIGLILPADSGEKMGLQITVMLTVVIYIDVIQNSIPVYDTVSNSPLLLTNFIISTCLLTLCLIVSTHTLFLEHVKPFEYGNFGPMRAKASCQMAKILNFICCGLWHIDTPKEIEQMQHYNNPYDGATEPVDMSEAFHFYATMIDRTTFAVISTGLGLNALVTFASIAFHYGAETTSSFLE